MKKIAVALQGGGSHGSFAWGVLDRLFEDGRFDIVGMSGTSAGGMNAASAIQGLIKAGPEGARETMRNYWKSMSDLAKKISPYRNPMSADGPMGDMMQNCHDIWQKFSPLMPNPFQKDHNLDKNIMYRFLEQVGTMLSPYDLNPKNINPFLDFVRDFFDFSSIRASQDRKIFLGATHVATGTIKIFSNADISADVLMASACLPFLFQAVKIDGEHYWDGGYIANPAVYPLIEHCDTRDILIVQLRRTHCPEIPKTQAEIANRLKEITYNGCLVREMRAIHFVTKLIDQGIVKEGALKRLNIHMIKNEDAFKDLNLTSALNADWDFLSMLHEAGRQSADRWIKNHFDDVGSDTYKADDSIFGDFVRD